jgi:hypothetical protein
MRKFWIPLLLCVSAAVPIGIAVGAQVARESSGLRASSPHEVNPVVDWNKTLLAIVRTKGAQSATVHPTRSFAILHVAIYDAVNAIDRSHESYLIELTRVSRTASQDAAAASSAHEILTALYPLFQSMLDDQLQHGLRRLRPSPCT